jgi:CheY-like chemotaxis protein
MINPAPMPAHRTSEHPHWPDAGIQPHTMIQPVPTLAGDEFDAPEPETSTALVRDGASPALLRSQLSRYDSLVDTNAPLTLLVADDEKRLLDLLTMSVQFMGHKVIGRCTSGPEALKKAGALMPDLVIIDVDMPGGDGIEAAKAITETLAIPTIVATGLTDSRTMARVASSNIRAYLVKPYSSAQLKSTVRVAIAQHRNDLAARCQLLGAAS